MRFNILINQIKALEWELNLSEAALFNYFYELPSWATTTMQNTETGNRLYYSAKSKIISELPILTSKTDTVYRLMKSLEAKGLIQILKANDKDFVGITDKAKSWNEIRSSEIYPLQLGKKSDLSSVNNSEKNPTYNTTNTDNSTIDKSLSLLKNKKDKFYKDIRIYQKAHPDKYPAGLYTKFISHWAEVHKSGKKIRLDDEPYFEIGKRLATFWQFTKEDERNTLWKEHNAAKTKLTLDL